MWERIANISMRQVVQHGRTASRSGMPGSCRVGVAPGTSASLPTAGAFKALSASGLRQQTVVPCSLEFLFQIGNSLGFEATGPPFLQRHFGAERNPPAVAQNGAFEGGNGFGFSKLKQVRCGPGGDRHILILKHWQQDAYALIGQRPQFFQSGKQLVRTAITDSRITFTAAAPMLSGTFQVPFCCSLHSFPHNAE
jgi:hypothetical protein